MIKEVTTSVPHFYLMLIMYYLHITFFVSTNFSIELVVRRLLNVY